MNFDTTFLFNFSKSFNEKFRNIQNIMLIIKIQHLFLQIKIKKFIFKIFLLWSIELRFWIISNNNLIHFRTWCQKFMSIWSSKTILSISKLKIWRYFKKSFIWIFKYYTFNIRIKNLIISLSFNIRFCSYAMSIHAMSNFILSIIYNKWTKLFLTKFIIFNIIFSSIFDILIFFKIFSLKFFFCRRKNEKNDILLISSKMLNSTTISICLSTSHNFIKKNINNMFKHTFSLKLSLSLSFTF